MDKKSLKDVKRNNTAKVLEYILKQGPVSRIEIAEQSRFSPSTVSMAVSLLLKDGIVEEVREGVSTADEGRLRMYYYGFCFEKRCECGGV